MEKRELLEEFLVANGWSKWYSENNWVNPKIVDPKTQDYTNYGMNLKRAIVWELMGRPTIAQATGIPSLNMMLSFNSNSASIYDAGE